MSQNVCTNCGVSTDSDTCPQGCMSTQDPTQPKPTVAWATIPTKCWDCGKRIDKPPHRRAYLGQCDACTAIAIARDK